jgi:hypothetical protein
LIRELAEMDSAQTEFSVHGARAATQLAAAFAARAELRRTIGLGDF